MCRLLGYVATGPTSLRDLVGDAGLDAFTALSTQHRDGWGMAWCETGGLAAEKAPGAAKDSDRWHALAGRRLSDCGIAHLRWATPTLDVTDVNTHPFVEDGMAFAHNGRMLPVADVDDLLPAGSRAGLAGTTDSERYFALIRSRLTESGDDVLTAFRSASDDLLRRVTCSSLNSVLLTESTLYAVSCFDERLRPIPAEPEHFVLRWRRSADAVVVASSGWSHDDWDAVPNGHVLVVDRASRDVAILPFATPPGAPEPAGTIPADHRCT